MRNYNFKGSVVNSKGKTETFVYYFAMWPFVAKNTK